MEKCRTGDMQRAGIAESTNSTPKIARSPSALAGYSINLSQMGVHGGKDGNRENKHRGMFGKLIEGRVSDV